MAPRMLLLVWLVLPGANTGRAQQEPPASQGVAIDFAAEWRWAQTVLPELAKYRPLDLEPLPLSALLAWVPAGSEKVIYDADCRPLKVRRQESALVGERLEDVIVEGGEKRVTVSTLQYGTGIAVLGPGWTTYRKDQHGKWVESGGGGCGCAEFPEGTLRKVTGDVAWYNGAIVQLEVKCGAKATLILHRPGGDERVERSCTAVQITARGERQASKSSGRPLAVEGDGEKAVERLQRMLSGREFLVTSDDGAMPTLFRSRKACDRFHGKRRVTRSPEQP